MNPTDQRSDNLFLIHNYNTVPVDLLSYCKDYIIYDCSDKPEVRKELKKTGIPFRETPNTGHNLTSYFRSDRQVILNMYHGYGKEELERFVLQTSLRIARNYIAAMPEAQGVSKEDQDTVAHMIAYLFFGIMVEWTGEEMVHDEDYRKTLDTALSSLPAILKSMHGKQ